MNSMQKLVILGILISGFSFAVSFATLYAQTHILEGTACTCTLPIPILIPTFASLGIFIGLITYSLLSPFLQKRYSKSLDLLLDMLEPDEALVVKSLLNNNGEVSQAKLSKELGKVKAHRIIERLKQRGIVEKESYGKTKKIKLSAKFLRLIELPRQTES